MKIPKVSKDVIYDTLERQWRIGDVKGHNNRFKSPKLCVEGGFSDIFVMDLNVMEPTDKVYLQKDDATPQCTQYGLERRQGV